MKLSEKGSEGDSEGGSGQHEAGQTGRKRGSRRSMGPRHGRLWDFSDSFITEFSEDEMRRPTPYAVPLGLQMFDGLLRPK